jgi:hypothetical protein
MHADLQRPIDRRQQLCRAFQIGPGDFHERIALCTTDPLSPLPVTSNKNVTRRGLGWSNKNVTHARE